MDGQNGQNGQYADGYALGVDLGTSNTVAVLRRPDGRTRPLLFDGQPILPSGVFLRADGQLHVGRDAQRLAQADPARYEPNPKRRVDEAGVLLGEQEVPTVDLLAAVLGAVARAAVEAVGFLPPAVLTYPASWGARRRDVLTAAVARAGWPPVGLVPEPVAAARYFADVLRRPVPVGASIAVFDFGGGTLDIAVVRNEGPDQAGRPRFAVTSSGGVAELGGLDLDAALVEHLDTLLSTSAPDAWRRLSRPQGTGEWRDRWRYWDEVRAAKEMLSRSTTAPVAVPGVEQAAHLTRDELEQLITPLLRRGVAEAASVIGASHLQPPQLAGLFLVGGSSRVPLVSRLLHAELGVAPTVLEQPELPVAEGALAELPAPAYAATAPTSPAVPATVPLPAAAPTAPTAPAEAMPAPPDSPPVSPAPAYPPAFAPPPSPHKPVYRRPAAWLFAAAVVALLAVGIAWIVVLRDRYPERDFQAVGNPVSIPMGGDASTSYAWTHVSGDVGYIAWQDQDYALQVKAINLPAGDERWHTSVPPPSENAWAGIIGLADGIAVVPYRDVSVPATVTVLRGGAANQRYTLPLGYYDTLTFYEKTAVRSDRAGKRLVFIDNTNGEIVRSEADPAGDSSGSPTVLVARTPADYASPSGVDNAPAGNTQGYAPNFGDDDRLVVVGADKSVRVFSATTGTVRKTRANAAEPDDHLLAYDGHLYVAGTQPGYQIVAYDLDKLDSGEPRTVYRATDDKRELVDFAPCGPDRICVLDRASSDDDTVEVAALATDGGGQKWRKPAAKMDSITQVGDRALVRGLSGSDPRSILFDPDGSRIMDRPGTTVRIDGGNVLVFAGSLSSFTTDLSVAGLGVRSGKNPVELGQLSDVVGGDCSWNRTVILCPGTKDFRIWRFAAD